LVNGNLARRICHRRERDEHQAASSFGFGWGTGCRGTVRRRKRKSEGDLQPRWKDVAAESAGATVKGFSTEKKGETFYEAELVVNRAQQGRADDASGACGSGRGSALDSLSAGRQSGTSGQGRQGKILKVESLTKKGKLVAYEAKVDTTGKSLKFKWPGRQAAGPRRVRKSPHPSGLLGANCSVDLNLPRRGKAEWTPTIYETSIAEMVAGVKKYLRANEKFTSAQ